MEELDPEFQVVQGRAAEPDSGFAVGFRVDQGPEPRQEVSGEGDNKGSMIEATDDRL